MIFKLGLAYQSMIVCSICKVISNGIEEFEKHLIGQHGLLDSPYKIVHYVAYLEQRITALEDRRWPCTEPYELVKFVIWMGIESNDVLLQRGHSLILPLPRQDTHQKHLWHKRKYHLDWNFTLLSLISSWGLDISIAMSRLNMSYNLKYVFL